MSFDSITFIVFFIIVQFGYHLMSNWDNKKLLLLLSSYLFYGLWNPPYLILLLFTTLLSLYVGNLLVSCKSQLKRKILLIIGLLGTLGVLGFYKYSGFILGNIIQLFEAFGIQYRPPEIDILLPIGISFYTFQALSYVLDCYRHTQKEPSTVIDFSLYVSFFPQLIAGPIVRTSEFIPQCQSPRDITFSHIGWGGALLVTGLFMKVVLADAFLAPVVDKVYDNYLLSGSVDTLVGILGYSGQIYFDFAGYSTCAIGVAMCFGFALPDNFRYPYSAIGFSDFWKRWHISLSKWLRDYLYISIGGNKQGRKVEYRNLMLTMLIAGLWHGASWMFVIWGGLHGLFLIIEHLVKRRFGRFFKATPGTRFYFLILTFILITLSWIPFRSPDAFVAINIFTSLLRSGVSDVTSSLEKIEVAIVIFSMLAWQIFMRNKHLEDIVNHLGWALRVAVLVIMIVSILSVEGGESNAYIYFQF